MAGTTSFVLGDHLSLAVHNCRGLESQEIVRKNLDEFDTEWVVKTKDPAIKLVRQLEKANFSLIILPRSVYITGQLPENMLEWKAQLHDTNINNVRLADCIAVLLNA